MRMKWCYHRFQDGRWYASNGRIRIYANILLLITSLVMLGCSGKVVDGGSVHNYIYVLDII